MVQGTGRVLYLYCFLFVFFKYFYLFSFTETRTSTASLKLLIFLTTMMGHPCVLWRVNDCQTCAGSCQPIKTRGLSRDLFVWHFPKWGTQVNTFFFLIYRTRVYQLQFAIGARDVSMRSDSLWIVVTGVLSQNSNASALQETFSFQLLPKRTCWAF